MKIHINEKDTHNNYEIKKRISASNSGFILGWLFLEADKHGARLGQELVNQDYVSGVFPTLFYCTEDSEVVEWFYQNIVITEEGTE